VLDIIEIKKHLGGHKYTSIMRNQSDFAEFGGAVIQHRVESSKLYCPVRMASFARAPPGTTGGRMHTLRVRRRHAVTIHCTPHSTGRAHF
jgi:hypothetical protein